MAAEPRRYVLLMGLEVTDAAGYARYRAAMRPLLDEHAGAFGCDLVVARVLLPADEPRLNRVFTISFPDRAARERFFGDERYRAVRAEHFEPAVARVVTLGTYETAAPDARTGILGADFHGDSADRLIVATAKDAGAPLVTRDQRIRASRCVETLW